MTTFHWPQNLTPENAHVFAHNELHVPLPPSAVWPWLARASRWHEFYRNCKGLCFHNGDGPDLALGTKFSWQTFGAKVTTTVDAFEPERYLAWTGVGLGSRGHHAFALEPDRGGCLLVTEEVQRGLPVRLLGPLLRRGLLYYHQRWLEGLAKAAMLGHPDDVARVPR